MNNLFSVCKSFLSDLSPALTLSYLDQLLYSKHYWKEVKNHIFERQFFLDHNSLLNAVSLKIAEKYNEKILNRPYYKIKNPFLKDIYRKIDDFNLKTLFEILQNIADSTYKIFRHNILYQHYLFYLKSYLKNPLSNPVKEGYFYGFISPVHEAPTFYDLHIIPTKDGYIDILFSRPSETISNENIFTMPKNPLSTVLMYAVNPIKSEINSKRYENFLTRTPKIYQYEPNFDQFFKYNQYQRQFIAFERSQEFLLATKFTKEMDYVNQDLDKPTYITLSEQYYQSLEIRYSPRFYQSLPFLLKLSIIENNKKLFKDNRIMENINRLKNISSILFLLRFFKEDCKKGEIYDFICELGSDLKIDKYFQNSKILFKYLLTLYVQEKETLTKYEIYE